MKGSRETGASAEDRACLFLESSGYEILRRNFYYGKSGEIDIICRKNGILVFTEVRFRSSDEFGGAIASIGKVKLARLKKAAQGYLLANSGYSAVRFDLISVSGASVVHIEDIIR